MNDPIFLTLDDVLQFHADQIEAFGGDGAILDMGKLESALAQPPAMFAGQYLHEDLAAMAAAYLFHIVQNHPFADGNKRTGTNAAMGRAERCPGMSDNVRFPGPVARVRRQTFGRGANIGRMRGRLSGNAERSQRQLEGKP